MASDLYTVPFGELSTVFIALALTVGFEPEIVPSSVAKMKNAGFVAATAKAPAPANELNTCPVGFEVPVPSGVGIVTTRAGGTPAPLERVVTPIPLSEIQKGLVALAEMPHGLTRWLSVFAAAPGVSASKLVCKNRFCDLAALCGLE